MSTISLTQFSKGSGCGCKVAPHLLEEILSGNAADINFPKLLVGNSTQDDAAVYDLGNGTMLISTVDFFTPIVNDAFTFGKIAAANALSDVYAMGGTPTLAIAVMGFPVEKLPVETARQIIAGAKEICNEAHIPLAGGHTIDASEPFFGLSVNGMATIQHLRKNSTAHAGDVLFITKPIGTGAIATAIKREQITAEDAAPAIHSMCQLNKAGAQLAGLDAVHAMTDVTGFGLLGHLIEMCEGAQLSAEINYASVPLLPGMKELCAKFIYADNTMRNWKSYETKTAGIGSESLLTLCDPQTNGGLMVAVDENHKDAFLDLAHSMSCPVFEIGRFTERKEKVVFVK
ncbi:MAG: selenide, water dikinase SelD [Bacteroidetes bacterium]|nr:selenide, water dikinase SelD [Bacteroidota bacterium]MBK8659138.1 selenide, water dikinase SelD [Bacteroidota bacterium]